MLTARSIARVIYSTLRKRVTIKASSYDRGHSRVLHAGLSLVVHLSLPSSQIIKPLLPLGAPGPRNTSRLRASGHTSLRTRRGPSCASPPVLRHTLVRQLVVVGSERSKALATTGTLSLRMHELLREELQTTSNVLYLCSPLSGRGPGGRYGVVAGSVFNANGLAVRLADPGGAFKPVICPRSVKTRTPRQWPAARTHAPANA